jgi:hypothetical protein
MRRSKILIPMAVFLMAIFIAIAILPANCSLVPQKESGFSCDDISATWCCVDDGRVGYARVIALFGLAVSLGLFAILKITDKEPRDDLDILN